MYVVTHPGQAHADEVLAIAFLLAQRSTMTIVRREPTEAELNYSDVYVVDIGGRYEARDLNFDHHQFDRDAPPACALTLILQHFNCYEAWCAVYPWVKGIEKMDSKGPFAVAKELGVEFDALKPYVFCPFAGAILAAVGSVNRLAPGDPFHGMLVELGKHLQQKVEKAKELWDHFDETTLLEFYGSIKVAIFDQTGAEGIESWMAVRELEADCVITKDDRGSGLSLFRRNDCPKIDFSRCEGMSNVTFAHKNGFIAKISDVDWTPVLSRAVTDKE